MSKGNTPITEAMARYIQEVSLREPAPLAALREEADRHPSGGMQISVEQGQLLHMLALITGARRTLEVGVFLGYSSSWVALALPPDGKLIACDVSEEFTSRARRAWSEAGVQDKVELRLGPALQTLEQLLAEGQAGTFDFVFIDADKSNYAHYYDRALQLVRRGGLIVIDNVLWHGAVTDPDKHDADTEAIRAFNRLVHQDPRVMMTLVTVGDGLTLACKL